MSTLMTASSLVSTEKNNLQLLEFLLSQPNINVNKEIGLEDDEYYSPWMSWTALMVACEKGHPEIVSRLVQEEDLDVNINDHNSFNAVHKTHEIPDP